MLMDTSHAHAIYRDLLYKHGHGLPLWVPEPDNALPAEQRAKGIGIGDVGILTDSGGFEYLWNVHVAAGHPYNNFRVPPGFEPLSDLDEGRDVRKTVNFHPENTAIHSKDVKKRETNLKAGLQSASAGVGVNFTFSAAGDSGAVLVLPRGATRMDAKSLVTYRQYAVIHAKSWYQYLNGDDQNRGVKSGALCLVTGVDKCSSWGVASFTKSSGSDSVGIEFEVPGAATAEASVTNFSSQSFGVEFRTNAVDASEQSQSVFLRGFVISVRDSFLARMLRPKVTPLRGAPALPSFVGSGRPFASHSAESDLDISVELSLRPLLQKSPAAVLGDKLLNQNHNADIVVVHDDDCTASTQREGLYQRDGLEDSFVGHSPNHAATESYVVVIDGVCTLVPEEPTRIAFTSGSVTLGNTVAGNFFQIQRNVSTLVTQVPPQMAIKPFGVAPAIASANQRLFALVIGINVYKHVGSSLHNLKGAVADADDMNDFLISTLAVHPSHICNLRDDHATRDDIIGALTALTLDDRIQRGDAIVIFFAGHGSQTTVPNGDRRIEMIIPHDFLPATSSNMQQQGILDITLADLLTNLAKEKGDNITVIFDTCHAGSSTRDRDVLSRGITLPEDYVILSSVLPSVFTSVEKEEKSGFRHAQVAHGFEFYGLASHVLLAACKRTQSAYESNKRGRFTRELLSKLRTTNGRNVTYRSLIRELDALPGQHPQCEGTNVDRVLFDGKASFGSCVMYSVKVAQDGAITLDGGDIHGITKGAEFDIYATKNSNAQRLCRLFATDVHLDSCDLAPVAGPGELDIPQPAWALQATPGLRPKLGVVLRTEHDFRDVKEKLSENRFVHFVDSNERHELELHADGNDVVFVVADQLCEDAGLSRLTPPPERRYTIGETDDICAVLEAAADFFFHLRRSNSDGRIANDVVIEAYELRKSNVVGHLEEHGSNLVDGAEIPLIIGTPYRKYGFKLINNGSRDLYVWAFLFNVGDLHVEAIHTPGDAKDAPDHSLPAHDILTLGYGTGGAKPREFYLDDGVDSDVTYLKVFVTSEHVKLSDIVQASPFERKDDTRRSKEWSGKQLSEWDTLLVTIVQKAAK